MQMVVAAITALKEKGGSSSQAIRKYIKDTYDVDMVRQGTFIRKALKTGVEKGDLIQTKGKGAAGSFKLDPAKDKAKAKAKKEQERANDRKDLFVITLIFEDGGQLKSLFPIRFQRV